MTAVQALEKVLLLLVTGDAKVPASLKPLLPTLSVSDDVSVESNNDVLRIQHSTSLLELYQRDYST
jgi:hypothetical protein